MGAGLLEDPIDGRRRPFHLLIHELSADLMLGGKTGDYSFRMDIHYALHLEPVMHDLSMRTLERYIALLEQDELAKRILHEVTIELVDFLGTEIDHQRLDSTHIFSDMASFGRTRSMGVAIKRFLTQRL